MPGWPVAFATGMGMSSLRDFELVCPSGLGWYALRDWAGMPFGTGLVCPSGLGCRYEIFENAVVRKLKVAMD